MNEQQLPKTGTVIKNIRYENGRLYFTAQAERTFYFILTLSMLAGGVIYKIWI